MQRRVLIRSPSNVPPESMKDEWVDRWKDQTVVVIASGPSLTEEDCGRVKEAGRKTIVTNTTFKLCPWADVLLGFDFRWWSHYRNEVREFKGEKFSCSGTKAIGIPSLAKQDWFKHYGNSGVAAVSLALATGAKKVVLLGVDCKPIDGKLHWHGDHPKQLGNARSIGNWPKQFGQVAKSAHKLEVDVVNCSPGTALQAFRLGTLTDEL